MTAAFNTTFLTTLKAGWAPTGESVTMYLFDQAPLLGTGQEGDTAPAVPSAYAGINRVDDFPELLGWGPYVKGPTVPITVLNHDPTFYVSVPAGFALASDFDTLNAKTLVFAVDNGGPTADQVMFLTDTPLRGGTLLYADDSILPVENQTLDENILFEWKKVSVAAPPETLPVATEGQLQILKAPPATFEAARTQHLWIYPQRVNYIANPSFEFDTEFWRTNGTIALSGDTPGGSGVSAGLITGTPNLVLESNIFPLNYGHRRESGWTVQLTAKGAKGKTIRVGLISWDSTFRNTSTNWGREKYTTPDLTNPGTSITRGGWPLGEGYTHIKAVRECGDVAFGMLRIETDSNVLYLDQVCVESGRLPPSQEDWPYFDGSTRFGAINDFTWYGGPTREHASYSCWYNNRDATFGRLFAWNVEPPTGILTDQDLEKQGLAYQWVPAGTPVYGHLDVLYAQDPVSPLAPVVGDVLPYAAPDDLNPTGVTNPW